MPLRAHTDRPPTRRRSLLLLAILPALLWLAFSPTLQAQTQTITTTTSPSKAKAQKPSPPPTQKPFTLKTQVNLVLVPVIVRNKKGQAVGSLKRKDFRIFDNGKPQTIHTFRMRTNAVFVGTQESHGSAPSKPTVESLTRPMHFFGYLFDDVHLNAGNLSRVRMAAEKHLATHMGPQDRAAVFTTSGNVETNFTGDTAELTQAMNKIMPGMDPPHARCPYMNYYLAKEIIYESGRGVLEKGVTRKQTPSWTPDSTPLWDAATIDAMGCLQIPKQAARDWALSTAHRVKAIGDADTRQSVADVRWAVRRLAAMPGSRTLVLVSPGFLTGRDRTNLSTIVDLANQLKVVVNALDARGLYTGILEASNEGGPSSPAVLQVEEPYIRQAQALQSGVMEDLAYGTGGRLFDNSNNLGGGFDELASPPHYIYELGFRPNDLGHPGRYHHLKIRLVDQHGLSIQARRGYTESSGPGAPGQRIADQLEQALFSPKQTRNFPIALRIGYAAQTGDHRKLTVQTHIDVNAIHFRKVKNVNADSLTVVTGLFDLNENYLQGKETKIDLHLHNHLLQQISKGMNVNTNFNVPPGAYQVRVVVRDAATGQVSTANGSGVIP